MTSARDGASSPVVPGGSSAAGAAPSGEPTLEETVHQVEVEAAELADEAEDRPPPAGTATNLVTAAAVVVLGVATLIGSWALGIGSARVPAAGTWPLLVSALLVVLGLALMLMARRTSDTERFTGSSWSILAGLATMLVFVALIGTIGFEIPAALLAFVWLKFLGHEGWRMSVITSLAIVAAFYVIFVAALGVPIPHLF